MRLRCATKGKDWALACAVRAQSGLDAEGRRTAGSLRGEIVVLRVQSPDEEI